MDGESADTMPVKSDEKIPVSIQTPPMGQASESITSSSEVNLATEDYRLEPKPLRYIFKSLEMLRSEVHPDGTRESWKDLSEKVAPYQSGVEFSDNVRSVVREWVAKKIPKLKEKMHTLRDLSDTSLLDALSNSWYETLADDTGEAIDVFPQRRGVLLSVLSHGVRRVEKKIIKDLVTKASPEDLEKIGLDSDTGSLVADLLDISFRTDPLFTRCLAFSQLGPDASTQAEDPLVRGDAITTRVGEPDKTIRTLFPHETQQISKQFSELAETQDGWVNKPGGIAFREYIKTLSLYYNEKDPTRAKELRLMGNTLFAQSMQEGFPITLINGTDDLIKAPYIDPELRIAVHTKDAAEEEQYWEKVQYAFANSLDNINAAGNKDNVLSRPPKANVVLGGYGVNMVFNGVAQEEPSLLLFLDEQIRAYDREFPQVVETYVTGADGLFKEDKSEKARLHLERMSRTGTILHELGHQVIPDGSEETDRFGSGSENRTIQEVKAENLYRALIPSLIEKGALEGTKEQWAAGLVSSSIQVLRDGIGDESDDYFRAAAFSLNNLFSRGALRLENGKVSLLDYDLFFSVALENAQEIVSLHRDETIHEERIAMWIRENCTPTEQLRELLTVIGQQTH